MKGTCKVSGCDREVRTAGMCGGHYHRYQQGRPLEGPIQQKRPKDSPSRPCCYVLGCYRPSHGNTGICVGHYRRKVTMGKEDWARPLKLYRRAGTTRDIQTRVSREVAEALTRQAKAQGLDRSEWLRIVLERHVKDAAEAGRRSA